MTDTRTRAQIQVTGVVQGVGFRPFVVRRAGAHDLAGTVRNTGDAGVEIVLDGAAEAVEAFLTDLHDSPPPLARVESVSVDRQPAPAAPPLEQPDQFRILDSVESEGGTGTIPPDTGICEQCLSDIRDPESRYHGYWATSCVDCGPRYTVIRELPYDRPRTAMDAFPMCEDCATEYERPTDRRYHAQTIACPTCGPTLKLAIPTADGRRIEQTGATAIRATRERLADGDIVAIKGIGGTHLACSATEQDVVDRLRTLTGRPAKPFAIMARSIDQARELAAVSETEASLLEDVRRPIVVLDRSDDGVLDAVAPGLHTVGVMLPYAGLHHLLFDGESVDGPLVMTSANRPGEPMCVTVDSIFAELSSVIDAALVHDREIVARCDDSVVREVDGSRTFLRRSRGWVPQPLSRQERGPPGLAVGAEFDGTVAVLRDDEVIPSQHLGDLSGPASEAFLDETVEHLTSLLGVEPAFVACDMHPSFLSSQFAREYAASRPAVENADGEAQPIPVQHHHAHAASLLAEHDREQGIVIVADGTGYGPDDTIWGGEVLDTTRADFTRVGGLSQFRLPGGEAAIEYPTRILASLLDDPERIDALLAAQTPLDEASVPGVRESLAAGVNAPITTSAGRFLDAISALLGVCPQRQYEGQPAIELEAVAAGATPQELTLPLRQDSGYTTLDVQELAQQLLALAGSEPPAAVAATAQDALARGLARIAVAAAETHDRDVIGFSGGVAYNEAITRRVRQTVEAAGFQFLAHRSVPPGDAGLSYGQGIVATAKLQATKQEVTDEPA
ncbi:carbamoyltransferase HypF [Halodesulfurarchaeum sp. HSR-GB]|uniref:carbamoyltransferase HypF n=1 Tax=Halodesulfurarchaeum sp. HSR-GB TaxID=3074077 RepID=UPI0028543BF1|nr:carbamoyltransferase HypF [Halodesulfurarchaeum sp. HSR-GB]MDR5657579.1 carbamoyltransferase HypF [Halodesulfurarchaeum sp. HSR-GB]